MLPLSLLRTAQGHHMVVELKNGDTYNGRLVNCDSWMNINLVDVIFTSRDGDRFWKMTECYIRGNTIKYLRIPEEIIEMVTEDDLKKDKAATRGRGRGRALARGRGSGRDGGRGAARGDHMGGRGRGSGRSGPTGRGSENSRGRGYQRGRG